jgi:hypothetical protein
MKILDKQENILLIKGKGEFLVAEYTGRFKGDGTLILKKQKRFFYLDTARKEFEKRATKITQYI